jgi:Ca2+-binding EF-hand superfamily protein
MKAFVLAYLTQLGEENRLPEKQFDSMFAKFDGNNDGQISKAEMKEFIEKVRATQVADIQEAVADMIHQEEVKELIDEIWVNYDKDNSGLLSKAEMKAFVIAYLTKFGEESRLPKAQFNAMFASVDLNGDGQISK